MTREWEYKIEDLNYADWPRGTRLNELGKEGWELVNIYVFDRVIADLPPERTVWATAYLKRNPPQEGAV